MSLSALMVVQPLLDAAKSAVSGSAGNSQGDDAGPSFQTCLQGQMSAGQSDAQRENQTAEKAGSGEPVREGQQDEKRMAGEVEKSRAGEEDAAVLAQIMAAAAGAQMMPVEPLLGQSAVEPAGDADVVLMAASEVAGRMMPDAAGIRPVEAKEEADAGDAAAFKAVESDAGEVKPGAADARVAGAKEETAFAKAQADAGQGFKQAVEAVRAGAAEEPAVPVQPVQPQAVSAMQTQQVQMGSVADQADPAASRVMQQLGTPEWNQAIGQRVLWMVGKEQQSASLTLNPPELGPVRVVVSVSNNQASANFFSANPDVRQALEGSLPRLREMMEGAGIQLGQAQVGAENAGGQQAGQASFSGGKATGVTGGEDDAAGATALAGVPASGQKVSRGLVDTFA